MLTTNWNKIEQTIFVKNTIKEVFKKTKKSKKKVSKQVGIKEINYWVTEGIELSPTELIIVETLDFLKIEYLREVSFEGCYNPNTNGYFRFDFYIPSMNLVIEYDGEHHKDEYFMWADGIKNTFLQQHNINLKRLNKKHFYNLRKEIRNLISKI